MPNYQNGKIYKIWCEDDVYFGSTCKKLSSRMANHRSNFKDAKRRKTKAYILFQKYGIENCKIELVELFPCNSKEELNAREGFYIRNNKCVNKGIPNSTPEERALQILEGKRRYNKGEKWKVKHEERVKTRPCEICGGSFSLYSKAKHERTKKHLSAT